jgi:hypothetical protein
MMSVILPRLDRRTRRVQRKPLLGGKDKPSLGRLIMSNSRLRRCVHIVLFQTSLATFCRD